MKNEIETYINKNNALVEGSVPGRSVMTNKVLNSVYYEYQKQGKNIVVKLSTFFELLDIAYSGTNFKHIEKSLDTLRDFDVEIRNFEFKGNRIILGKTSLITYWGIEIINNVKCLKIEFSDRAIEYMKHTNRYTEIERNKSNQFKSKYGIVLYEIFKRYEFWETRKGKKETVVDLTLEQLNSKFATEHKYISKVLYAMKAGIIEFEKISGKNIKITEIKKMNMIKLSWKH